MGEICLLCCLPEAKVMLKAPRAANVAKPKVHRPSMNMQNECRGASQNSTSIKLKPVASGSLDSPITDVGVAGSRTGVIWVVVVALELALVEKGFTTSPAAGPGLNSNVFCETTWVVMGDSPAHFSELEHAREPTGRGINRLLFAKEY